MAKNIRSQDIEKLIRDYSKVLEITSIIGTAIPEEFLPATKNEIKNAILITYASSDGETRKLSGPAFILLTGFVPIDEALTVYRFNDLIKKAGGALESGGEIPEISDELHKEWARIENKISKEGEEYLKMLKQLDSAKPNQE